MSLPLWFTLLDLCCYWLRQLLHVEGSLGSPLAMVLRNEDEGRMKADFFLRERGQGKRERREEAGMTVRTSVGEISDMLALVC